MSGPKISEYELEQLRKAELQRRERETNELRSSIVASILEAQQAVSKADQELSLLDRQLELLLSSSLSLREQEQIISAIKQRKQQLAQLKEICSGIIATDYSGDLERLRETHSVVSHKAKTVSSLEAGDPSTNASYQKAMSALAENLCAQFTARTYTLEEIMPVLPSASPAVLKSSRDNLDNDRSKLVNDARELLNSDHLTADQRKRIEKVIREIPQITNGQALRDVQSFVINEIRYQVKECEKYYPEYRKILASKMALLESLGENCEETGRAFSSASELKAAIQNLRQEVAQLEQRNLERAEREEIARGIDEAMQELGYHLIGDRAGETKGSKFSLYQFENGTGIRVLRRANGSVRMRVIGVTGEGDRLELNDEQKLQAQNDFCEAYDAILEALSKKGIMMRQGADKRSAPDLQHWRTESRSEYTGADHSPQSVEGTEPVVERPGIKKHRKIQAKRMD